MPKVLFVEDDIYFAQPYRLALEDAGFDVRYEEDASNGLGAFEEGVDDFAVVILDMAMPAGPRFSPLETRSGFHAGLMLSRSILRLKRDARVIGLTNFPDPHIAKWFSRKQLPLLTKYNTTPEHLLSTISSSEAPYQKNIFIVHGHDTLTVRELMSFIDSELDGCAPIILSEERTGGLTVIEKFEKYSDKAFVAIILMTPDDSVIDQEHNAPRHRARQNVIFEFGYFLGRMGRANGRVLILKKGDVEIPSDTSGMVMIDISQGILNSSSEILRELKD